MKSKKRVVYYNMKGDLSYEHQLLKEWNIENLELIQVNGNNIIEDIQDSDALTLEYTNITADILEKLPKLKIIALHSIGTNEIDIDSATEKGIYVTNSPGFCSYEVASHAMALLLNLNRKIMIYNQSVKAGVWGSSADCSGLSQLRGKTCGLVSLGSIPQTMIPMLKGFGINIVFYSRSKTEEDAAKLGITKCDTLDELLSLSDIVSLHTPLTDKTKNMINETSFSKMKDNVIIINTARGELIDEQALLRHLKSKKILGAGLDVLADEENHNSELITMDNVIVTPHVGYLSQESLLKSKKIGLEQIVMALSKKQRPTYAVNKRNMVHKEH